MVDLCSAREPGILIMSGKTRVEFLYALQEAAAVECIDRADRIAFADCASKLSQLWGAVPSRYSHNTLMVAVLTSWTLNWLVLHCLFGKNYGAPHNQDTKMSKF